MFFSWYAKNRHFKKGRSLSGQIMPFLLVIIAIFLGAAVATVQIGKGALNMTCRDNAADACALAAASTWALALNTISKQNVGFRDAYTTYYAQLEQLVLVSNLYLTEAQRYIDWAKEDVLAGDLAATAVPLVSPNCTKWTTALSAANFYTLAASDVRKASSYIAAARVLNSTMENITEAMKKQQNKSYCKIRKYMRDENKNALDTGAQYAQTYSCAGVLPAEVYVPSVKSYELEVAKMNNPCPADDPYSLNALQLFVDNLNTIATWLGIGVAGETGIYWLSVRADRYCDLGWAALPENPLLSAYYYGKAWIAYAALRITAAAVAVAAAVYSVKAYNLIAGPPTIKDLIKRNKEIAKALKAAGGVGSGRIVSSKTCDTGDMLIIGINHVTFQKKGCVTCEVGGSIGTAAFSGSNGGLIDPRYFGVGFTPRLTNESCPGNGGIDVGSVYPGKESDGGCQGAMPGGPIWMPAPSEDTLPTVPWQP